MISMNIGLFLAMALVLALPTGAVGGGVLLVCSIFCLAVHRRRAAERLDGRYELLFLGSMILYPLAVALNCLVLVEPIQWRYFDNPSRFLMALPIYWAIRKSRATPEAMIMGAIVGASIAGIHAILQWTILDHERSSGFTNALPFAHITLFLICIALTPISLPGIWRRLRILGAALGVAALVFSQTLGAWAAAPILVFMMMRWAFVHYNMRKWWSAAIVITLTGLLFMTVEMRSMAYLSEETPRQDMVESEWKERIPSIHPVSSVCRIELWKAGWIFFSRHPWFGIGFDRYRTEAIKLQEEGTMSFSGCIRGGYGSLKHAHNDFVQIGATMGGPAILAYLLPLIFIYWVGRRCCRRHDDAMGIILKVYAVGNVVFSLTQSQLNHNVSTTFFAFTAVSLVALAVNRIETEGRSRAGNG